MVDLLEGWREPPAIKIEHWMEVWAPFINHQQFLFHSTSTKSNFFDLCWLVDGRNAELIEQAAQQLLRNCLLPHQSAPFVSFHSTNYRSSWCGSLFRSFFLYFIKKERLPSLLAHLRLFIPNFQSLIPLAFHQ